MWDRRTDGVMLEMNVRVRNADETPASTVDQFDGVTTRIQGADHPLVCPRIDKVRWLTLGHPCTDHLFHTWVVRLGHRTAQVVDVAMTAVGFLVDEEGVEESSIGFDEASQQPEHRGVVIGHH